MKKLKSVFVLILVLSTLINCARRGNPSGGPKDEDAPITIKTIPEFKTVNFDGEEIKIYFDEYIKLEDISKNLIVSPPLKYPADITPLGTPSKRITIKIKDTLKENTTYTFNFGESIVDNNESNPLTGFKYIFSTGNHIDSLSINGSISNSFKKEKDKYVSVLLYEANKEFNDSTIYKEKPLYVTNSLDSIGWEMDNLKAGKYHLIALHNESNNLIYNPKTDKIAFADEVITIPSEKEYNLNLFKEILEFKALKPVEVSKGHIIFPFEGNGDKFQVKLDNNKSNINKLENNMFLEKDKDTLNYYFKTENKIDSLFFSLTNNDYAVNEKIILRSKEQDSLKISVNIRGAMSFRDTLTLEANNPLTEEINKKLFSIINKDTLAVDFKLQRKYNRKIQILFDKEESQNYKVLILPNAITDFFNQTNKDTLKYNLRTNKKDSYGSISLNVLDTKNKPVIIQLLSLKEEIIEQKYINKDKKVEFELLKPEKYLIRIILDDNNNNIWDTGSYLKKMQPEKVIYFNGEIEVKENWFVNESISL